MSNLEFLTVDLGGITATVLILVLALRRGAAPWQAYSVASAGLLSWAFFMTRFGLGPSCLLVAILIAAPFRLIGLTPPGTLLLKGDPVAWINCAGLLVAFPAFALWKWARRRPTAPLPILRSRVVRLLAAATILMIGIPSATSAYTRWRDAIHPTMDPDHPDRVLTPPDLRAAVTELDRMLPPSFKSQIKNSSEQDLARFHFGFGRWMRNNWRLWGGSLLSDYFWQRGVEHPDDMSAYILREYRRHLHGHPIREPQLKQAP